MYIDDIMTCTKAFYFNQEAAEYCVKLGCPFSLGPKKTKCFVLAEARLG